MAGRLANPHDIGARGSQRPSARTVLTSDFWQSRPYTGSAPAGPTRPPSPIDKAGGLRSTGLPSCPTQVAMPDIHALLWPRHVALIGASADLESLRGRIMHTMAGHPFQGQIYPVTRSQVEVMGRRAYASIDDLPEAPQLAVLIIPAQYI